MQRETSVLRIWSLAIVTALICAAAASAQEPGPGRGRAGGPGGGRGGRMPPPESVLKVDWQLVPGKTGARPGVPEQVPIEQGNITDGSVVLHQYGAGTQLLTANGDPRSVWSGECEGPFAITFSRKDGLMDLGGQAKVRWVTKTSGFHAVRPVVKLADGTMLVGDYTSVNVPMLALSEFPLATIRWIKLDPKRVVTLNSPGNANGEVWFNNPDLSKVEEFGFADLMPSSGHGAGGFIHLGSIEVFGRPVAR